MLSLSKHRAEVEHMSMFEERGRPIWFNTAEQRVMNKALKVLIYGGGSLTGDDKFILRGLAPKFSKLVEKLDKRIAKKKR